MTLVVAAPVGSSRCSFLGHPEHGGQPRDGHLVAAASNEPSVAISNSVGGIAAQTAFIVALDVTHRGANLERASASLTNVFNALLMVAVAFTAVATSLPELITGIAAVRAGALALAVGGIIGGNTFDVLFIAVSDIVYQRGSLYAEVVASDLFVIGWTMLLTGILGAGLIRRQRAWIGFEGFAILGGYVVGLLILSQM